MVVMYSTDMSAPAKAHAVGVLTGILILHESKSTMTHLKNASLTGAAGQCRHTLAI